MKRLEPVLSVVRKGEGTRTFASHYKAVDAFARGFSRREVFDAAFRVGDDFDHAMPNLRTCPKLLTHVPHPEAFVLIVVHDERLRNVVHLQP